MLPECACGRGWGGEGVTPCTVAAICELIGYSCIYSARMSPALNECSVLQRFERSNAIEIRNWMMFNFYSGLPHVHVLSWVIWLVPIQFIIKPQLSQWTRPDPIFQPGCRMHARSGYRSYGTKYTKDVQVVWNSKGWEVVRTATICFTT